MKVRFLQSIAGPNMVASPGSELELDKAEAKRLIEAGIAEAVKPTKRGKTPAKTETATEQLPVETATAPE